MLSSIMSRLKEAVRVCDDLRVRGVRSRQPRGMRMPDGAEVPVEVIMERFGVDRSTATAIAGRRKQ